ncbi:hypothetical protein KQH21_26870 [Streptomyces sp. IpFD-1.1]|uniref:hypothetical protein n=1 Tax=Streptomyces TaxID=1883 RepID=UPI00101EEA41|nr:MULTISPECIES: hypothetical protein [Streptomyces]MCO6751746.1 hypothetical protein [Streptomyces sp. IpFD-1.1]RZE52280.1 hypothetical protein C0Q98_27955 [Streptomyces albidoflavus]
MNTWIVAASEAASETVPLVTLGVIGGLAALMFSGFVIVALVNRHTPPQTSTPPMPASAPAPRSGWMYTATVAAVVGVVVAILAWLLPR